MATRMWSSCRRGRGESATSGPTHAGKTHDKKVADCEQIAYPRRAVLHKDMGFQGYEPKAVQSKQVKKSRAAKN